MKFSYRLSLVPAVALCSLTLLSCKSENAAKPVDNNDAPKIVETTDASIIAVQHPEQFPLVSVDLRDQVDELKVNGAVSPDVSLAAPVNALVSGRVSDVKVRLGDYVHKGDVLLTINSPELSMAFQDYQKFKADEELAKAQLARAQVLYDGGAMAKKELEVAQGVYHKAQVDTRTTEERIRLLGGDPNRLSNMFQIVAPASGVITEQNVTASAGVKTPDNQPNLFIISDLSTIWVLCDVYENNLAQVHLGENAQVRLAAYPDQVLKGRISNISSLLDPNTRTAKVRIVLPNPKGTLRPGMFASVTFFAATAAKRLVIPSTAVIRLHDKDWVFVPQDDKHFRRVEIQTSGAASDGYQVVLGGLEAGAKVVRNALQFSSYADNNS